MKAVANLLALPFRQMLLGSVIVALAWVGCMAMLVALRNAAVLIMLGLVVYMGSILAGTSLRSLLRPEVMLLPYFGRKLAMAGAVDALFCVILPVLALLFIGAAPQAELGAGALLLVCAIGIATGLGMRVMVLLWLPFLAIGWMPKAVFQVLRSALDSPLLPLALALGAALLLRLALRPFLELSDRDDPISPLASVRFGQQSSLDGVSRKRGALATRINSVLDGTAQRAFDRSLARFRTRQTADRRMALVRALLLPHDNPAAIAVKLLGVSVIAAFYFIATHAARRWSVGYVGAYAVVIGTSRFAAVGSGMVRMRPNLADLYLTLAPQTRRDFQATMADSLLWLIGVSLFNSLAYGLLIVLLLHDDEPAQLLAAIGITAIGGAFGALAFHLIGPESQIGRVMVQFGLVLGVAAVYALVYWLLGHLGLLYGGVAALMLTLPFGLGTWYAARKQYLADDPRFDAPLA